MNLTPLGIEGAWLYASPLKRDNRGYFREWFKHDEILAITGIDFSVQQANVSNNNKGVIRGIHYSLAPSGQAKWVTCLSGSIIDVIVDIRPNSSTFKKIEYVHLKQDDGQAVLVGSGLGHGFVSLEVGSTVSYLTSSNYDPENEYDIQPTDKELDINWHLHLIEGDDKILSQKDAEAPTLKERRITGKLPT